MNTNNINTVTEYFEQKILNSYVKNSLKLDVPSIIPEEDHYRYRKCFIDKVVKLERLNKKYNMNYNDLKQEHIDEVRNLIKDNCTNECLNKNNTLDCKIQ